MFKKTVKGSTAQNVGPLAYSAGQETSFFHLP